MSDQECFERITRLEEQFRSIDDMRGLLYEIRAEQNKQKGFYAGLIFGGGIIFSAIGFLAEKFLK